MARSAADEDLLAAFVRGERAALGKLAGRYEVRLLGLAAGMLGGQKALACDAIQETWLRVIRFGGSFNGQSGFKTWLYRIAINQCRSLQKARTCRQSAMPLEGLSSEEARPDEAAQTAERNDALRTAVAKLGNDKGLVLLLCYHEGMTHNQAAEILEIPVGTLKSRLHAALKALRAGLSSEAES